VQEPKSTDIGALFHAFYLISSLFGIIFSGKKVGARCINFLFRRQRKKWLGFYHDWWKATVLDPNRRNATLFPMKKDKKEESKRAFNVF
jgi:hypothetical protein